ncbi:hypothetical protein KHP62_00975 [Rhodobacteraceae bacterium NNCM2]|nr:hypothetical protein [Coraliihabitans acroporae]
MNKRKPGDDGPEELTDAELSNLDFAIGAGFGSTFFLKQGGPLDPGAEFDDLPSPDTEKKKK